MIPLENSALERVREAVLAMPIAHTLGLSFRRIERGEIEIEMPIQPALCFRPGQLQAAAIYAVADFAAVDAAATLLPPGWINATIDGAIKLVAPARGDGLRAHGRVVDAGRLLTICAAEVYAVEGARNAVRHIAGQRAQHRSVNGNTPTRTAYRYANPLAGGTCSGLAKPVPRMSLAWPAPRPSEG